MKIVIATPLYPPDIGGPATYSKVLAAELPKHGFEVLVISFGRVRHWPKVVRHLLYFFLVLKGAVGADIVFAQDPVSVGLPTMIAAKILRKKFFLKVVGDYAWEQYELKGPFITPEDFQNQKFDRLTELRRRVEKLVSRQADKIIVPSKYLKGIVSNWLPDPAKIQVVYNSFEPIRLDLDRESVKARLNLTSSRVLTTAGRLVPWKGILNLIELVPELLKFYPNLRFFILGDGPERQKLTEKISKLNLNGVVSLIGQVDKTTL